MIWELNMNAQGFEEHEIVQVYFIHGPQNMNRHYTS